MTSVIDYTPEKPEPEQSPFPDDQVVLETADKSEGGFHLPEPDLENLAVLTTHLPNKPILPWNHYDSPWENEENQDLQSMLVESKTNSEEITENLQETDSDALE